MPKLNANFDNLANNYLFAEIGKRTAEYKAAHSGADVISLGVGDVTLPLPMLTVKAGKAAAAEMGTAAGFRGYAPYDGYDFLKDAVKHHYMRCGVKLDAEDIYITDGAKNGIGNFLDLFDADNTVLVPDPVYPAYVDANVLGGRRVVYANANKENGFLAMPDHAVKADIIYICSPNNPTGAAYTVEALGEWVRYAKSMGAVIFYDAAYEAFIGDVAIAHSIFQVEGAREVAVEFCSLSKTAGFTGVRCGWNIVPKESPLNALWMRRQAVKFNGTSYIVQRMAESALTDGYPEALKNIRVYRSNAKVITDVFDRLGIEYTGGENAPYVWFNCRTESWAFFDRLLNEAQIVCTPGSGFGANGEGYVRLTSFNTPERTREAMKRFERFWTGFVADIK